MFVAPNERMMTYTSADFDKDRRADYTLLVSVGQGEHALAIVDGERQLKFVTAYDPATIDQQVEDILALDFGQVKMVVSDHAYAFIPAEVFDETQLPVYRRYLSDDDLAEPLVSDVTPLGIKLIYQFNKLGLGDFMARFPHAAIHPSIEVLLRTATYGAKKDGRTAIIHQTSSSASICFFDSGKFIYSNDFEIHGADDLNYYLLSVLEHLGMVEGIQYALLSGDMAEGDEHYRRVAKYSEQLAFADVKKLTGISIPGELELHQHRFLTLFGLNLCV